MEIKGICPIAPAVFDDSGTVVLEDYGRCCEGLLRLGAQSLTLFGIAGEYHCLDSDEEELLMEKTVQVCHEHGAGCIISNTKHSTQSALRRARRIEELGADCMMVLPPFFLKPGGKALFDHLDALIGSVGIPVMFQYAPDQTGVPIAPEMLVRLAECHENLRYFKIECKPPGTYVSALTAAMPKDRQIFVGNAGFQMIEGFQRGAQGVMPGPSMPDVYRKIWDALLAGDESEAWRVHGKLNAMLNHIRQNVPMIIHFEKRILKRRGLVKSDFCRQPGFVSDAVYDRLFDTLYGMLESEFKEVCHGDL